MGKNKNHSVIHVMLTLLFLLNTLASYAQSCYPDGYMVFNQQGVDDFIVNNPDCTNIEGELLIFGNGIDNLDGFKISKG